MTNIYMLLLMVFLHIVDDYYLQGWLASAKQRDWWKKNAPQTLYKRDYVLALLVHGFSWAFMTMLPIAFTLNFSIGWDFIACLFMNLFIHAYVDHLKANAKKINLWTDQSIHICQIVLTWLMFV